MSGPSVTCHGSPALRRPHSKPIRRVSSRIRPKVMPVVGLPKLEVLQTVMPRSAAAAMSIERLRAPVVIRSFSLGSASRVLRRNGVRSRIMTTMSKSASARCTASAGAMCSLNTVTSTSAAILDQSASFNATFWKSSSTAQRYRIRKVLPSPPRRSAPAFRHEPRKLWHMSGIPDKRGNGGRAPPRSPDERSDIGDGAVSRSCGAALARVVPGRAPARTRNPGLGPFAENLDSGFLPSTTASQIRRVCKIAL